MNQLFPAAEAIARAALAERGLGPEDLRAAVDAVHAEALSSVGLAADDGAIDAALPPPRTPGRVYRSEGSMQTLFQRAVRLGISGG